ncbi:MAG: helicase, partial [Myxococcota bacterium]
MPETLQHLFEIIREACTAADWSRGVELARAGAVCGEQEADGEIALRVSVSGSVVSPSVLLVPEDGDWDCDCRNLEEACCHVAAAIIALRQARRDGAKLPGSDASAVGRIGYRLSRTNTGLAFERVLVRGEEETALHSALAAIHSGRVQGPRFAASSDDLEVESALGTRLHGDLPPGLWPGLLTALQRCNDVQLDGETMRTSSERLGWEALLVDHEGGFRLRVRPDPRIEERFACGVVRAGDLLCLAGESRLTGREREDWLGGRDFTADQAAELVGEVLPSLSERIPVTIRSKRLPRAERLPPRISLEVRRDENALSVLPSLVYGDPACARVDAGRLVLLRDGPLPLRDEAAERQLLRELAQQLELVPGHRAQRSGEEAIQLAQRLEAFGAEIRGDAHRAYTREPALVPHFETREGGFQLHFESGTGEGTRRAEAGAVLSAWRAGESLLPLAGGGFAPLPGDWLAEHGQRLADLLAARNAA